MSREAATTVSKSVHDWVFEWRDGDKTVQYFFFWGVLFTPYIFCDIQLVVTVLSHRCNSRTDLGEAKVESHASSETRPRQAALLDTLLT
jgi:hypothetical protein